jgi:HAD superfamily hydrolase (TIGR01509 family)
VSGIVFDLDGTLVDSYGAITASLNFARRHYNLDDMSEQEVRLQVGRGLEALIYDLVGPDRVDNGVKLFREYYATAYEQGTRLLPDVRSTLAVLHENDLRMTVASNKPARFTRPILELFGLLELFDDIQGPDTAGSTKPEPAMIQACVNAMNVSLENAVYIGDMVMDVESADRAGLDVILIDGGSSTPDSLRATGRRVLEKFADLPGELAS